MASGTLHHFGFALFHLEYFGMAVGALELLLIDMVLMAKGHRPGAPSRFEPDVAPAYLFLLSIARANRNKAEDTDADDRSFAKSLPQVHPSFPVDDPTGSIYKKFSKIKFTHRRGNSSREKRGRRPKKI